MRALRLISTLALGLGFLAPAWAHNWPQPAYLPLNTMVDLKAPPTPVDKASAPKRFRDYHFSSHSPYQQVYRFRVEKGQRYTLVDCHPAMAGKEVWPYVAGANPVSDYTYALSGPSGTLPGFALRFQQPWPIEKNETATCDANRHNFTISAKSEHTDLFLVVNFNNPAGRSRIMLKTPADSDQDVERSTTSPYRPQRKGSTWGSLWPEVILRNIPGETPVTPITPDPGLPDTPIIQDRPHDPPIVVDPPVTPPANMTLETDSGAYAPGAPITLRYAGIARPAAQDWIGLYKDANKNDQYGEWHYLGGKANGSLTFKAPSAPGSYEFRLFLNWPSGGYTDVARSRRILVQEAPPPKVEETWIDTIRSGRPFQVVFDATAGKFNDNGWQGDRDPMGTLKGGETYTVVYRAPSWTVTGFNEGSNARGTWTYDGQTPEAFQLNLWGRGFVFSRNGEVFDFDYGLVGHLKR